MMEKSTVFAAGFLALGFTWIAFVMLFVEPGMGFESPADFLDAGKVASGYASRAWFVSNLVYLAFPVALTAIAFSSDDALLRWSGMGSALLWLVVASIDRVGVQLPDLMPTDDAVVAAVATTLPIRFAVLKALVVTLGIFAWRSTRVDPAGTDGGFVWRGLGWLVLALSLGFVFVFIPMPVIFAVWSVFLAARCARAAPRLPAPDTIQA